MSQLDEFIAAGIHSYAPAIGTVRRFEVEVLGVLRAVLKTQVDERRLVALDTYKDRLSERAPHPWICVRLLVKLDADEAGQFRLGLWWDPEQTLGHDCVIYAGLREGPDWAHSQLAVPQGGITEKLDRGTHAYLIAPLSPDTPLEVRAAAVLAEYLDAFDAARPARSTEDGAG